MSILGSETFEILEGEKENRQNCKLVHFFILSFLGDIQDIGEEWNEFSFLYPNLIRHTEHKTTKSSFFFSGMPVNFSIFCRTVWSVYG